MRPKPAGTSRMTASRRSKTSSADRDDPTGCGQAEVALARPARTAAVHWGSCLI